MQRAIDKLVQRSVSPASVQHKGTLTVPRTFGVYELADSVRGETRKYRMGNHPIRMLELEAEFKRCKLLYLFRTRPDAAALAVHLNARETNR